MQIDSRWEPLLDQLVRGCCIDQLNRQALSEDGKSVSENRASQDVAPKVTTSGTPNHILYAPSNDDAGADNLNPRSLAIPLHLDTES